jgi:hypothetical protein
VSDERLREAERKWKETGSVDDEARYLLERVRVGDLTQERLELAAYCGHEASRVATVSVTERQGTEPETWAESLLGRFGRDALLVAALAAANATLVDWESMDWGNDLVSTRYKSGPRKALTALSTWLRSRNDDTEIRSARDTLDSPAAGEWAARAAEGALSSAIDPEWKEHMRFSLINSAIALGVSRANCEVSRAALWGTEPEPAQSPGSSSSSRPA